MALQILPEKFEDEDDITSLVEEKILDHILSIHQHLVHSNVKFLWCLQNCLGKFDNMDMKNSFDDELKRSYEDTEFNHFVGVMDPQTFRMDEHQNSGIFRMDESFEKYAIELIQNKDAKFKFYQKRNAGGWNYHLKPSSIWTECVKESQFQVWESDILHAFVESSMNCFTIDSKGWKTEPCVALKFTQPLAKDGKMTSQLQHNSTSSNYPYKHKETLPTSYPRFQHKRKEIAQHVSFVVVMSIIFGDLFLDMWIQPSHMKIQSVSIWASLLGLFGFMAFVWAVAIMILVGVPFVSMQSFVLTFWAIWMHLKSHNNSISAMFVPILGIVFFGVFARGKV